MEFELWAYQITPGSDESLYFAYTEEACRQAALDQRAEVKRLEADHQPEMTAMALYRYNFRALTAAEMVGVLNGELTIIEACAVDRKLIGLVVD